VNERIKTLQRELKDLRAEISLLERSLEERPESGFGEGDPAVTRWELDRALLRRLKKRAASVEGALRRLNQGKYGICEQCGKPIHPDRLSVLPDATTCIRCARRGDQEEESASQRGR